MEPDLEDELNFNAPDGGEDELPTTTIAEPRLSTSGHRPPPMYAPGPSTSEIPSPPCSSPSKPRAAARRAAIQDEDPQKQGGLHHHMSEDEEESTVPNAPWSDPANVPLASTSTSTTAAASECPLCARPFTDNNKLNAHVDWCLSREAIRSAQVEGDRRERIKTDVDVQHLKEWWKGGFAESTAASRKPKRRRKLGG
jgi:hypothetical protein